MTITISLPEEIDIDSYGGLQAFLIRHLMLSDDVIERIQTLIRLGEVRLARLLTTPSSETTASLVTVAGSQEVSLPTDFDSARQLRLTDDEPNGYPLDFVTVNTLEGYDYSGKPTVWAKHGNTALLGPIPDAVYTLVLRYSARLEFLNDNNTTNWLLSRHPDAYVYMCCAVICQHLEDLDAAAMYLAQANAVIDEINREGQRRRRGGVARLRSPVVV
jgi:hypothetical protein